MPRERDKRADFAHAYEVAAREYRAEGKYDEARELEQQANALRFHIINNPVLPKTG